MKSTISFQEMAEMGKTRLLKQRPATLERARKQVQEAMQRRSESSRRKHA